MALKDTWQDLEDKIQGEPDSGSDISVEPINNIAHAVIDLEENEDVATNTAPYIGDNGNWYVYDVQTKTYIDSGMPSRGEQGLQGDKGEKGADGKDGYTPQKGIDYYTEADKQEMVGYLSDYLDINDFELGNISIYNNGWYYDDKNSRVRTKENVAIPLNVGDMITIPTGYRMYIGWLRTNGTYGLSNAWVNNSFTVTEKGFYCLLLSYVAEATITDFNEFMSNIRIIRNTAENVKRIEETPRINSVKPFEVNSINHRGYQSIAPENTIPAVKLSKKKGFDMVEVDVRFTSDGVPVLLHDASINRTARNADGSTISGTINISAITYDQALTYDFGIWKSAEYAGTKIPTLAESIDVCKKLSIHPYIEVYDTLDSAGSKVGTILDILCEYGMENNITFISSRFKNLFILASAFPNARYGFVEWRTAPTDSLKTYTSLMRGMGCDIFVDISFKESNIQNYVDYCKGEKIPLEVYDLNNEEHIKQMNSYITGVTADILVAKDVLYNANIE